MAQLSHSRLLFAAKHYGRLRQAGIRAGLALGHVLRIAVWGAASLLRPAERERVGAERAGLRVVLGRAAPPLGPYAESAQPGATPAHRRPSSTSATSSRSAITARAAAARASWPPTTASSRCCRGGCRSRCAASTRSARPAPPSPAGRSSRCWSSAGSRSCACACASSGAERLPTIANWPDGKRFAAILTHDVEGPLGVANVRKVIEIERRHGFVSSWNFVAEWYPIEDGLFDHIRAAGGEIGLHAIKHDCKLFESRANFEAELPAIHRYLAEWDAVGFRSPATHRNADWMPELGALYDSSFPDTDPFEPQGGGCCSILPYFLDDLVELPITLVQDHTLWEILAGDLDRPLDREERLDRRQRRADQPDHPPRLPRHAGAAAHVRGIHRIPRRPARRLVPAAARGRRLVANPGRPALRRATARVPRSSVTAPSGPRCCGPGPTVTASRSSPRPSPSWCVV